MSLFDYQVAQEINATDPTFGAIIMAAVRKADTDNMEKLRHCWPDIVREREYRYWSGGGLLPEEVGYDPEFDENLRLQAEDIIRRTNAS